jgi:carboxynorspermidine decarboxylase
MATIKVQPTMQPTVQPSLPDLSRLPTPCYVIDERLLQRNLEILDGVQRRTGCKILLALKGYSLFATFPLIGRYLAGVTASSLHEARLGREEMNKEVHIFAPAYRPDDFPDILRTCDHIVFNSFGQWRQFRDQVAAANAAAVATAGVSRAEPAGIGSPHSIECGLRVNPGYSEIATALYDPCAPFSRLGVPAERFQSELEANPAALAGLAGLHFHALCEQNSDTLWRVARKFDEHFGSALRGLKWLNLGGGHHITRPDYDLDLLARTIAFFQDKYGVQIYLEPGEAIALNTGYLVTRVLDVVDNGMPLAILDTSAACHMPDVLEMPYRPEIIGAGKPGERTWTCRLGGPTCLAGDVIGDYSFAQPLQAGDILVFTDMAHYTMVKNNTFNGINLPAIALYREGEGLRMLREFGYADFKARLS